MKYLLLLLLPLSALAAGKIINADIAPAGTANIARNKMASGTNYAWCVNSSSGVLTETSVTASRAVATDANGAPAASATTATELGYVNGVTSAIQTQLNGKQASGNYITALTGGVTASGPGSAAATVITNANLTGPITSVGNATAIASQTGTGSVFVVNTSPTIVTPSIAALANLTSNGVVQTSAGNGTLTITDPSTDWLTQYAKLAGRSGGQVLIGGTASQNNLTLESSSGGVGSVVIAPQASEKAQIGPTGSTTRYNDPVHFLVPNSNSLSNGFIFQSNESNYPTTQNNQVMPNSLGIFPHDAGGEFLMAASTGGAGLWRVYRDIDGLSLGYMSLGGPWGVMNGNAGIVTFRVSGTTGQSVDLQQWSILSDYGATTSSVGSTGEFRGPAGLVTKDTYGLQGTTGLGMYFPTTSSIGFSVGGAQQMSLSASGMTTPNIIHTPVALAGSDINWQAGSMFTKVLSANTTFTFSNKNAGQTIIVKVINPSTYTVTWPNTVGNGSVMWTGSVPPVATTGNNARSVYTIFYDGTDTIGTFNGNF